MGFMYHKLPERRRPRSSGLPSGALVIAKRVVVKVVGIFVGRRRWAARHAKSVASIGLLWARMRKAVGLPSANRKMPPVSYDLDSYALNFDDGVWKEEDEDFWRSGSFAYRFGHSVRLIS